MTDPAGYPCNLYPISTPYGPGCHIDSSGNNGKSGYDFFALSNETYPVGKDGTVTVSGYFRQDDTFNSSTMPGRRELRIFIMYSNDTRKVVKQLPVLSYLYGTTWYYRSVTVTGLTCGMSIMVGVGRHNGWSTDWDLTAEWTGITVTANSSWSSETSPSGQFCNLHQISTPYGLGEQVDTIGSGINSINYSFFGYKLAYVPVDDDGQIQVWGYFRLNDTLNSTMATTGRDLTISVMYDNDTSAVASQTVILTNADGTNWVYKELIISGLRPASFVTLGFGRWNNWSTDYRLSAEWTGIGTRDLWWGDLYYGLTLGVDTNSTTGPPTGDTAGPAATVSSGPVGTGISSLTGFLLAIAGVMVVLLIFVVAGYTSRRPSESEAGNEPVHTITRDNVIRPETTSTEEKSISSVTTLSTCPNCGTQVKFPDAIYCQSCGASLVAIRQDVSLITKGAQATPGSCIICGLPFRDGSDTVRCPYCGGRAHRMHMLEQLHVNGACPVCRRRLKERDLIEP
jgi:rubredoxin